MPGDTERRAAVNCATGSMPCCKATARRKGAFGDATWTCCGKSPPATRRLPPRTGALPPLARADELARLFKQGGLHIELLGLQAFALHRCGEDAQDRLREAVGLAETYGLRRVFADAHPDLGEWVRRVAADEPRRESEAPRPRAPARVPAPG